MDRMENDVTVAIAMMRATGTTHYVSYDGSRLYLLVDPENNQALVCFGRNFKQMDDEELNLFKINLLRRLNEQQG